LRAHYLLAFSVSNYEKRLHACPSVPPSVNTYFCRYTHGTFRLPSGRTVVNFRKFCQKSSICIKSNKLIFYRKVCTIITILVTTVNISYVYHAYQCLYAYNRYRCRKVKMFTRLPWLRKSARKCFALWTFPNLSGFGCMVYSIFAPMLLQLFSLGEHNMC
jgi:hypothetical protein